ncbi:MAG: hypothetical protein IIZ97_00015 [Prevotella sp.]|nr:hypothetical protein [Prevotella sp.]
MTRKVRKELLLVVFNVLNTAKYGKLDDQDKIKVWKIARMMKPIATKFDEETKDAAEKMKPGDDFDDRLQKAQEFERLRNTNGDMSKSPMGAAEYQEFIVEFKNYQKLVSDAVKEYADKEVEIEFEPVSEEVFGKLMSSNDWTVDQTTTLGDFICE